MGVLGVLGDIAIFAQLSGLHIAMLISLAARLVRIPQCEAECAKLEQRARRLRALLQWLAPDVATQLQAMVAEALVEANGLVDTYRRSTLWRRVRTGRSLEARLRDARNSVDCMFGLVLCAHASNLLTVHPASDTKATVISDPLHSAETCDRQYCQGGGADDQWVNTELGEFE